MTTSTLITIIAVIAVVILIVLGIVLARSLRTKRLKARFGPEYDRTVDRLGDKSQAEDELEERLEHMRYLKIRSLSAEEVNRFALEWENVQAEFVDAPQAALQKANGLIREVMSTRGYPVDDFDQRVADISVDYPDLAPNYQELHDVATQDGNKKPSTEEMRQAMLHGRDLFENLLQRDTKTEEEQEKETA